ncbi:MAG: aldo/keto reductase, partial [Firmicutes bacterium]|nr:aldo/keto reductase [Bacillota bacterium]
MLEERILGRSGLKVTALGYGAMELRNFNDPQRAEKILNTVLDNGIRFIDTSQDY